MWEDRALTLELQGESMRKLRADLTHREHLG